MTLRALQHFKKVAEVQHFTKAANELHVSQPSLSYSISELEKELGVNLFDRKDKKVELNYFGNLFLEYVNKALQTLEEGKQLLKLATAPTANSISIGYLQSLNSTLISNLIEHFHKDPLNQKIKLSLSQNSNSELIKNFYDKKIDIIFCVEKIKNAISQPIGQQELCFVVSKNHPLTKKKKIVLKDLINEDFILVNYGTNLRKVIDKKFKDLNFKPKISLEMSQCSNIVTYVEKNLGISIVPKTDIINSQKEVTIITVQEVSLSRTIYASWFSTKSENIALKRIKEFILEYTDPKKEI